MKMPEKSNKLLKYLRTLLMVFLLVCIDQLIKIIILNNFMNEKFYFIDKFIGFEPIINTKYSYINSLGNFGIGLTTHIIVVLAAILMAIIIYLFINETYNMTHLGECIFLFLFSGSFCSLIDKIIWGGSLDYILVEGFFTFDLKDVYISIFEVLVISCVIFNYKGLRKFDDKKFFRELKNYIKEKFTKRQHS
jgi:signal peptidase II